MLKLNKKFPSLISKTMKKVMIKNKYNLEKYQNRNNHKKAPEKN